MIEWWNLGTGFRPRGYKGVVIPLRLPSTNSHSHTNTNTTTNMPADRTATSSRRASMAVCPYPSTETIKARALMPADEDDFDDLRVEHLAWANSMISHRVLRALPSSSRLRAVLNRTLKAPRVDDDVPKPTKMGLMFTGIVGVEILKEVSLLREEVSRLFLLQNTD